MDWVDGGGLTGATMGQQYAIQLANANADKVVDILDAIVLAEKINLDQTGNVFIAKDTRVSSEVRGLCESLYMDGADASVSLPLL